jgi:hypothetical protein
MRLPGWRWVLLLLAGLLLAAVVPAATAQDKTPSPAFLEGTEVFRRILFDRNFHPLESFDSIHDDPERTILIVFGDGRRLTDIPGGLHSFVARGGALFLATDRPLLGNAASELEQTARVRVSGQLLVCDKKEFCYHGLPYCPFLLPLEGADPDLFRALGSEDSPVSTVASNAPSYLQYQGNILRNPPALRPLAALPEKCYAEGGAPPSYLSPPLFAVGGDVRPGRVLVMADHSIFINQMMLRDDNSNVEFTYNCLNWLRGGENGARDQVLFVDDGVVNPRFDVPLDEQKIIDEALKKIEQAVVGAVNSANDNARKGQEQLAEVDRRDGFNHALLDWLRERGRSPADVLVALAKVLAVLIVLYGCWKIGFKARHRSDLQGPLLAGALRRMAPGGAVMEQRRLALIRSDNLWEPARDLSRQCLTEAGVPAGTAPPAVTVQGGWLRRWTMAGRVKRLWRLAYGSPARVSLNEWRRLLREVQELKTALADGTVRFL